MTYRGISWIGIFLLIIFLVGVEVFHGILTTSEFIDQRQLFERHHARPSVTFLLGEDKQGQHYFTLAEQHFLKDSTEGTDQVVRSCRSLAELIEYLDRNAGDHPWGLIQIVVHGNVWSGLSLPMWQDGPRAYPKDLLKAVKAGKFPKLRQKSVDEQTKINFWACGIGKNPYMKLALDRLFENDAMSSPQVYVSPHFVIFKETASGIPNRLAASYWPYFFKRGYRPSDTHIAAEFEQSFPEVTVDWSAALRRKQMTSDSALFHNSFHIPVVWTKLYNRKEDRPSVKTMAEKTQWIEGQPGLQRRIDMLGIPKSRYHWTVNKVIITQPDGSRRPAIKAIGMATVICVMRPISS